MALPRPAGARSTPYRSGASSYRPAAIVLQRVDGGPALDAAFRTDRARRASQERMAGAIARAMPRDYREKTIGPSAIKRLEDRPDQRASSDSLDQLATVFELDIDWLRMVNQERIQQPGSVNLRSLIDKALELDDEGRETAESFLEGLRRKHGAAERDPVKRRRQHE